MGYVFAIITSFFFTAYVVPKKLSGQTPYRYSLFQGMGFFAAAAVMYVIIQLTNPVPGDSLFNPMLLLSALAGVVWFCASTLFMIGIDKIGLSRANQWKNLQGPCGAVFNLLFLAEYKSTNVLFVALASLLLLASAMLFNIKNKTEKSSHNSGIICALISAVLFALYAVFQKNATNHGLIHSQIVYVSLFVFLSALVFIAIKEKSLSCLKETFTKDNLMGILGGALFYLASFFAIKSYNLLPGSVTFTIIQLNSVWTVLIGILIFKEIDFRKNWIRICVGILTALAGIVMLMLM
ncbi:MAG: GRP family sugar transporter [Lachnospiraceae bacterium]|jgi:glucose uptake protein GlcU